MNLYTIVTNDTLELPVLCNVRVREAAQYLHTTPNAIRRMICRPPKKSAYKPVITGKVAVDRQTYEKRYRMENDRSEYFRERWRKKHDVEKAEKGDLSGFKNSHEVPGRV